MSFQIKWRYTHDDNGFTFWERISREKVAAMLKRKFPKDWQTRLFELEQFQEHEISDSLWIIRRKPEEVLTLEMVPTSGYEDIASGIAAAGQSDVYTFGIGNRAMTSLDGITWTIRTSAAYTFGVKGFAKMTEQWRRARVITEEKLNTLSDEWLAAYAAHACRLMTENPSDVKADIAAAYSKATSGLGLIYGGCSSGAMADTCAKTSTTKK